MNYLPYSANLFARSLPRFNQNRFMGASPLVQNIYQQPIAQSLYPQQYGGGYNGFNNFNGFNPLFPAGLGAGLLFGGGFFGGLPYGGFYGGGGCFPCPPIDCGNPAIGMGAVNGGFDPSFAMNNPMTW